MKASFNVLDQGWIPVVGEDGARSLLGIREVLARAHTLREISEPSPLEEYSLYRFLGLFLMDALRPQKRSGIRALLREGRFDMRQIETYIGLCVSEGVSFDLFDETRPFLQSVPDVRLDGAEKPVAVLDCTLPSGNNHTHFIHVRPIGLSPDAALRKMLATYWFCTAGAQGYPSGVYGAPPYFGVIGGQNLFGTLVNLLVPMDSIGLPFDDPPVLWRRKTPVCPKAEIGRTSWLQGMLFPTRRIRLNPDENGTVCSVYMSQGENYVNKEAWRDPYVTYRQNETSVFPLRPHTENPIWRNVCDLIDIPGEHASRLLRLYRELHEEDADIRYTLYGVETNQASYVSVQRHGLTLPIRLAEQETVDLLRSCVSASSRLSSALRKALESIGVVPKAVSASAVQTYEKRCEDGFWRLCRLAGAPEADLPATYAAYVSEISGAVLQVYESALAALHMRAEALCAAQTKKKLLYAEVLKLKKEVNL